MSSNVIVEINLGTLVLQLLKEEGTHGPLTRKTFLEITSREGTKLLSSSKSHLFSLFIQ